MGSSGAELSPLQRDLIQAWFETSTEFFLTGGSALVGWYGFKRTTDDVDLFTVSRDAFEQTSFLVASACESVQAQAESVRTSPSFHRYRVRRGLGETVLDVVYDPAPQIHEDKIIAPDGTRLDPLDEIFTNKICALVGRSEPRDFFDVYAIAQSGLDRAIALQKCAVKDGGVTPEALVYVLTSISWPSFKIPDQDAETTERIRQFFEEWAAALALELYPPQLPPTC